MKIIKNFIEQMIIKKNMKWVLVFLIVWWLFISNAYAAWTEEGTLGMFAWLLNLILSMASWLRIILASLAGKLMTNDMLYGSFLNLDASLWTLRNIMKNFANFALWFLVLFAIVKNVFSVFWSNDNEWSPLSVIRKTLIAGILIQMSWFFMWAVVDLSTIMTSAIGSFPSQLISSNTELRGDVMERLGDLKKWDIKFDLQDKNKFIEWVPNTGSLADDEDWFNELLDTILPSHWSVSWPLLFIGLSVFDFNDFTNHTNTNSETSWKSILLSLSLNAIVLLFFSLMMLFIFIFNLFRIMILWIIIPLLPVIVLLNVFKLVEKIQDWWSEWLDFKKLLSIKTILNLVFKPVIMVWVLSLILVILVLIKSVIAPNKTGKVMLSDNWNINVESIENENWWYTSTIQSEGIFEFSMDDTKNSIADIIVYFFGLFLIFFLVKIVIKSETWIWFIDKAMSNTFDALQNLATNLPVIPVAWWVSLGAIWEANVMEAATRMAWLSTKDQTRDLKERLGMATGFSSLTTDMSKEDFIDKAKDIATEKNLTIWESLFRDVDLNKEILAWNKANQDTKDFDPIDEGDFKK